MPADALGYPLRCGPRETRERARDEASQEGVEYCGVGWAVLCIVLSLLFVPLYALLFASTASSRIDDLRCASRSMTHQRQCIATAFMG
jgi:hypothetical protein